MKQTLLVVFALVITFGMFAQSHRFADSTAQWYMGRTDNPLWCNGCYSYSTEHFTITGDTVVNNRTYQKSGIISTPVLLRDSANRVYRYYEDREVVIYDFNYAANDTFSLENLFGNASMNVFCHVDSVDTVHLLYPRKRMYLTYNNQNFFQDVWIEGIGSVRSNFLSPGLELMGFDMPTYHTRCFYENDSLLLHTDTVDMRCQVDTFILPPQPAHWFADSSAQWNVLTVQEYWGGGASGGTHIEKIAGDTIINQRFYQIFKSYRNAVYVRKDISNRVYAIGKNDSDEKLLFDYNLQVGDSALLYNMFNDFPNPSLLCIVDSIDTVVIGVPRKKFYVRFDLGQWYMYDTIIEGIGTISTHFLSPGNAPYIVDGVAERLVCYFEDGTRLYHNGRFEDTCMISIVMGIDEANTISADISPNPTTNHFTLTLSQQPQQGTALLIHDALGRMVKREELVSSTQQISVVGLPDGLYTYTITQNSVRQASGKLVIAK